MFAHKLSGCGFESSGSTNSTKSRKSLIWSSTTHIPYSNPFTLILHHFFKTQSMSCWSNHQRCSVRKVVPRNLAKFKGKHLYQSLFFNKVAGHRPVTLLKKRLWHRCFSVNFAKFLRTSFSQNSGRLLL